MTTESVPEHLDVLIIGAGLSGIGAAARMLSDLPGTRIAVLEGRSRLGGTWDLFRYPGVRSDSDMFTLGYPFRPWTGDRVLAPGEQILEYIRSTAHEYGIEDLIRYEHRAVHASWSSAKNRWSVQVSLSDGTSTTLTCDFLYASTGYYRYEQGYTPDFPGLQRFAGTFVHPQAWPADLEVNGKRVAVIGSGATAVTLVPALAELGAQVTMVQRSPTYVFSLTRRDALVDRLRGRVPEQIVHRLLRLKYLTLATIMYQVSRRRPALMRRVIRTAAQRQLPPGFDLDTHFSPRYDPWDQRLCFAAGGDFFAAFRSGKASICTDQIETITEKGLRLASGAEVEADVIVSATGLDLQVWGGMTMDLDGVPVEISELIGYKGMMFAGIPNFVMAVGYTNASWTLKADLVARFAVRLLQHLRSHGYRSCRPATPEPGMSTRPFIDLASGYVQRSAARLPKQGEQPPWRLYQNYPRDVLMIGHGKLADGILQFER